ncbi:MAG TPA: DISARM system helicase DrmA [Mycobacteriales bacterium]|nr:DISARM system helicase DrmA [Mycobacteriales bacterium]
MADHAGEAAAGGGGSPPGGLDGEQEFEGATSYEVRDEVEKLVRRDLLGPWDGETERFRRGASGPRERYLVGMLGPKAAPKSTVDNADELPDTETGVSGDAADGELPDVSTPQNLGRIWASSAGLSFTVPASVDAVSVTAGWGRYTRQGSDEDPRPAWTREPVEHRLEVRLDNGASQRIPLPNTGTAGTTATQPGEPGEPGHPGGSDADGVFLAVTVRRRDAGRVVELALVNAQAEPGGTADVAWLFQAGLSVTATDGDSAIFLPTGDPADEMTGPTGGPAGGPDGVNPAADPHRAAVAADDLEDVHLRLLYRHARRYASGRNVAVHPSVRDGDRRAHRLDTTWLPTHDVPITLAPTGAGMAGIQLSMDALADSGPDDLRAGLEPLVAGYESWLDERQAELPGLPDRLRPAGEAAVFTARQAAARIRAGIALLTDENAPRHGQALAAFRFANRAMAAQRRHTTLAALREQTGLGYAAARVEVWARGAAEASWRPFQLAFVLLNLPALTDPAHPERAADATGTVDLLFFPTGGGKTEAYLGLTAFTFAIRRLQGVVGAGERARDGGAGVAVLMRYTLRLLTAQQFQRAAALVCAAEVIRREDPDTWGGEPFRIGLWVGGGVSPNWFDEAREQIAAAREAGDGSRVNVLQTLACPWCGTPLRGHHDLDVGEDDRRVRLFCPNGEGASACPFSRRISPDGLPILTVDEDIYRYAPGLVVATVDKLAQLPWRGFAGVLFGRVREHCPRHGYRHDDLDTRIGCGARHNRKGALPAVTSRPVTRLRPPDLVIQDELHLISGALGTTVGLFEAAVAELCTWTVSSGVDSMDGMDRVDGVGTVDTAPKIVASTATTRRAREQVLGVFGRDLTVFPPQVLDVRDTYFSVQVPVSPTHPGRRYLGVCAHGVRMKSAEIRLAEILLIAGQTAADRHGPPADPYLTLVGYFNATRELAGMRRYLDDQVTTRVRRNGRRKGLSDRIVSATGMLTVQELTSRISSADISDVLKRLEIGFNAELDTSARRRAIAAEISEALKSKPRRTSHPLAERWSERARTGRVPVDVVLATSMLQVGVDVSRFGLMVVTGQPKNTAEYIQASSRVGRDPARPGLVVTLYNWSRPRDLAHYEDFEHYHATFYRQVEALSVTPYTRRALDRGSAATFLAAVRHTQDAYSRNADAHDVPLDGPAVAGITRRLLARAEVVGGPRGRDYLAERIGRITDLWRQARTGQTRLGYATGRSGQQQLRGLLRRAGDGRWDDLTVGMSMRETENEINLLVPGGDGVFTPTYGAPPWTFGPPGGDGSAGDGDGGDGGDSGDELGESGAGDR